MEELSPRERLLNLQTYVNGKIGEELELTDGIKKLANISSVTYTPKLLFNKSGLSSTEWVATDGVTILTRVRGDFITNADGLVCNGANYLYPCDKSANAFHIRCAINADYVPVQIENDVWSNGYSCIFGYDLSYAQKDFGIVISKDGLLGLGVASDAPVFSNKNIVDGLMHDIDFVNLGNAIFLLFLDGELILTREQPITGQEVTTIAVFYTGYDTYGQVRGVIAELGYSAIELKNIPCPIYK